VVKRGRGPHAANLEQDNDSLTHINPRQFTAASEQTQTGLFRAAGLSPLIAFPRLRVKAVGMTPGRECVGLSLGDLAFAMEFDEGAPLPAAQRPSALPERAAEDGSAACTPRGAEVCRQDIFEKLHVDACLREARRQRRQRLQSLLEMLDVDDAVGACQRRVFRAPDAPSKAASRDGESQQEPANTSIDRFREALQGIEFDAGGVSGVVSSGFDEALRNHAAPASATWESSCPLLMRLPPSGPRLTRSALSTDVALE
jgi:hypothetical protein